MASIVSQITLKNFKFFHDEIINLKKNVLFYGENGSGKSSIYWALKIYFEHLSGILSTEEKDNFFNNTNKKNLLNRNYLTEVHDLDIIVTPNSTIPIKDTLHFINHKTLSDIFSSELEGTVDFFNILNHEWFKRYTLFDDLEKANLAIGSVLDIISKNKFDTTLKNIIGKLQFHTNKIMKTHFEEKSIKVKFKYTDTYIEQPKNESFYIVTELPKIEILVNKISNSQHHFNEAKLKLISLAIHFAIIKLSKPADEYVGLKLAVFDDFLQSLDMSYRDVVLDYIFQNFNNYQIIMMTHDLQFYKLLKRKTEFYNIVATWEYKNIYVRETITDGIPSILPLVYDYDNNATYLNVAETALLNNQFEICGNNCRKELEKTIVNLALDLELNNRGKLKTFFELFHNREHHDFTHYYLNPQDVIQTLLIERIEPNTFVKIDLELLRKYSKKSEFYTNIVLNPSSHDDSMERYKREFQSVIANIKELKKLKP